MSSDDTIADLLMSSQKNHQALSSEPEESIRNLTSLTEILQSFLVKWTKINFFNMLNNLIFGGQYSAEEIRNQICAFLIRMKHLFENL